MSESLWKYSAAPRCGTAAKTEPRISIYFNCSLVWNTTAGEHEGNSAPLLPTLTSFYLGGVLMRSWERKQWYRVERSKTLCITVARQHFKSVLAPLTQAHFQLHSESLVCDPLWYAYYFLLLDAELSGLQHQYTLSLSQAASLWVSPFLCRNAKSDGARPSPRGQRWAEAKWMN